MTDRQHLARQTRDSQVAANTPAALGAWVVQLLACPLDRGAVKLDGSELVCEQCAVRYPVLAGIPRMVPDQCINEQKF
jgi:uncharacterized protein YbaR (Trm112 family)